MLFHTTTLKDAFLIELEKRFDDRGFFARTFCADEFAAHGLPTDFPQNNTSFSTKRGTLRGMHMQKPPHEEPKVIRCISGAIYDVIVDLRPESPSFRKWEGFELSAANRSILYCPPGYAHGFLTLTDDCEVIYQMGVRFVDGAGDGLRYDDPALGIKWPFAPLVVSERDRTWPLLQG